VNCPWAEGLRSRNLDPFFDMFKDRFRIAFRGLRRQKGCVFLNVGGLAVALASSAIIEQAIRAAVANPVESIRYE
jgi:hypothetical protein